MSVPKYFSCVQITLCCTCHRFVDIRHILAQNEDADDFGNVFLHLPPGMSSFDLAVHKLVDVEVGTCLEIFLAGVLHLDQDGITFVGGTEKVENDTSPVFFSGCPLHILKLNSCPVRGCVIWK